METTLSQHEVQILISLWLSHVRKLKNSGDYPEKARDKVTYRKLTDLHYDLVKRNKITKEEKMIYDTLRGISAKEEIKSYIRTINSSERIELMHELFEGFCLLCGDPEFDNSKCYCDPSYDV